jgi:hypothetical protein
VRETVQKRNYKTENSVSEAENCKVIPEYVISWWIPQSPGLLWFCIQAAIIGTVDVWIHALSLEPKGVEFRNKYFKLEIQLWAR